MARKSNKDNSFADLVRRLNEMSNMTPEQERAELMEAARNEPKILDSKDVSLGDIAKLAGIKEYTEAPKVSEKAEKVIEKALGETSAISQAIAKADSDESLASTIKKEVTEEDKRLNKIAELEAELSKLKQEEKEEAKNETTEEEKPDSTESEESDVSTEESGEQEDIQSEEVNADTEVVKDIAATENKLKKNLKTIAKQIAKVTKETTKNLSKEDLFFKGNDLDSYTDVVFYTAKEIYDNTNMGLFLQIDLSTYSGEIYVNTSLSSYTDNDPVEVHRVKLLDINKKKRKLLAELEALKQ